MFEMKCDIIVIKRNKSEDSFSFFFVTSNIFYVKKGTPSCSGKNVVLNCPIFEGKMKNLIKTNKHHIHETIFSISLKHTLHDSKRNLTLHVIGFV